MPLFDNWPYVDLSKLNLDWVLRVCKQAEAAVNNLGSRIYEAVDEWIQKHPEAVTTVQDGSITRAKLSAGLDESITYRNDIVKEYTPSSVNLGSFNHSETSQIQGFTTDGTYLYAAGTSGDNTNPVIYVLDPATLNVLEKHTLTTVYGHPNSMDYLNGKLYITGCMPTPNNTTYRYLCIVDISNSYAATLQQLAGGIQLWSVAMLRAYNGKIVMAGHKASSGALDLFATLYAGSASVLGLNKFLPWRTLNIGPFSCDPAGMCQYGNHILIADAHLSTSLAKNCIRIFDEAGGFKGNIYIPIAGNNEIEDICCIGSVLYIVDISGNVYQVSLATVLAIQYDALLFSANRGPGLQFVYINDNGGDEYIENAAQTVHVQSKFRTIPWFFPSSQWIVSGSMQIHTATNADNWLILPATYQADGSIIFSGTGKSGRALASYYFKYTRGTNAPIDEDEYVFTLADFQMTAHFQGTEVQYTSVEDAIDDGYFTGYTYIRELTAQAGPRFTTTGITG